MTPRFVLVSLLVACVVPPASAAPRAQVGSSRGGATAVSPLCSLYVVTLTTELLTNEFNSPKLTYNAKKWPLLMAQARNARLAFDHAPLASVVARYDSLVRKLGVVGARLLSGDRPAALAELKAATPDLNAVLAVARRGHLACRSGSTVFYIR